MSESQELTWLLWVLMLALALAWVLALAVWGRRSRRRGYEPRTAGKWWTHD